MSLVDHRYQIYLNKVITISQYKYHSYKNTYLQFTLNKLKQYHIEKESAILKQIRTIFYVSI